MKHLILAMVTISAALAQPEVHPDRTVTFRLKAPNAKEVSIAGEWNLNKPQALTKDPDGVWSVTVGPVPANTYIYFYTVDGLTVTDPINPLVKLRARTNASMLEVKGNEPWDFRDVPHGAVEINFYAAKTLDGAERQIYVYTPPGYSKETAKKYPVLYLLHGSNDLAAGWSMVGHANLILDNDLAEHKAVPMIVVMPWGHALPFGKPGNDEVFEKYLLNEVMPLMEEKYRVLPGRENRAIVGLSMGGAHALNIGLSHLDLFSAIGVFGNGASKAGFEKRYQTLLADPDSVNRKLKLFWIGVGDHDPVNARAKELSTILDAHGIKHSFHEVEGCHTYPVWRTLFSQTAPLLFQKGSH